MPTRDAAASPYVLMYHSVSDETPDPYRITVPPAVFRRQLAALERMGLRGVGVSELLAEQAAGRAQGLVGLTFDDGYADFARHAMPELARHGFTASVFIVAGKMGASNTWDELGPRKPILTPGEVRDIAAAGMEIGSHGLHHVSLPAAPDPDLTEELSKSRSVLEEVSGRPVPGFCYPYGHVDARVVDAVRCAGYEYGCAIWRSPLTGALALPRTYVGDSDGLARLRLKRVRHAVGRLRAAR